jgi:hypothetical protein
LGIIMFDRFKKKFEPQKPNLAKDTKITEETSTNKESKSDAPEKTEQTEKPRKRGKKTQKLVKEAKNNSPKSQQTAADIPTNTKPFIGIKEYSSVSEIAENIDAELAETKSALGKYLRQLDDKRVTAERTKRIYEIVTKIADKKASKDTSNQIDLNGLEIILDASVLNELEAIENVVKSHQQRLIALKEARDALQTLDQVGDTEGIKYLTLEKEGIPEQILLNLF